MVKMFMDADRLDKSGSSLDERELGIVPIRGAVRYTGEGGNGDIKRFEEVRHDGSMEVLTLLRGAWRGEGRGSYPTIEEFAFEDFLEFSLEASVPLLRYRQKTRLQPQGEPSHEESGFIQLISSGEVEWSNAQSGGRVEVLRGRLESDEINHGFDIEFNSVYLGNDERLKSSRRRVSLKGETMRYELSMATYATDDSLMKVHIVSFLHRVSH